MYCDPVVPVLTDDQRAILQGRLTAAEQAYHDLLTGGAVQTVRDQNGESVIYQLSNQTALKAYIADLQRQLGLARVMRPLRPFFG